jgi:membrane protease YdiL (CAAX protease family)
MKLKEYTRIMMVIVFAVGVMAYSVTQNSTFLAAQLVIFSIPSLIYFIFQIRRGMKWRNVLKNLGLKECKGSFYLESIGIAVAIGGLIWLALRMVPPSVLENPMISVSVYAGWPLSLTSFMFALLREAFYVALGEEVFFRGMLGGWLVRRFGFMKGNTMQALVFLLPHLLLLLVSLSFWVVVVVQFLAGWAMGWLRSKSGSIFPGWLAHSLMNALGALSTMG